MLTSNRKFILDVPYAEKDDAKLLGAWWDPDLKKWYVPAGIELDQFKQWFPEENEDDEN
ncbi:MAG: hypothetical protein KDD56_00030 [Bdellovibrionales bacterium]|nr:hypothetical protein [Bdellovibrionales bacterium]